MQTRTAIMLINKASRSGAQFPLEECCLKLQEAGLVVTVEDSHDWPPESARTVEHFAGHDLVIIAGGDGSINRFLEPVIASGSLLAVIPTGTANDFARGLMLTFDAETAVDEILAGKEVRVDTAELNGKAFVNVAHLGFGTRITEQLSPTLKKRWGVFSYLKAFFSALGQLRRYHVTVTADGTSYKLRPCHMSVGNGRYYGGGNVVDQNCHVDDGQLSFFALRRRSVGQFVLLAPLLRTGTHALFERGFQCKAKSLVIDCNKTLEIHADGEVLGQTPATFTVKPKSLRVVAHKAWQSASEQSNVWSNIMNWIKSDEAVYINDVLNLAQESAQQFNDAADLAQGEELKAQFIKFAVFRRRLAERIERFEREQGELPAMNDPDSEWLSEVVNYFLVKVAHDEDKANIERRLTLEMDIRRQLKNIADNGYHQHFEPYLSAFQQNNERAIKALNTLLASENKNTA